MNCSAKILSAGFFTLCFCAALGAQQADVRSLFRVKYVANGVVYLDGGRAAGLEEGMKLEVHRSDTTELDSGTSTVKAKRLIANLVVVSVAESSAVCEIRTTGADLRVGDVASLSDADMRAQVERHALSGQRNYLQVVTFSEGGDPLDEEVRDAVPRPPSPVVNQARGRFGFEYNAIASHSGSNSVSSNVGVVMRADVTRIGGSFWNFSGYWRGRLSARSDNTQPQTITDLINRTYHLEFTYTNPNSRWVAGFGRLYIPYATSLNTLDGGFAGRRFGRTVTAGLFVGSTPDPTSWNYDPNRRIGGLFVNFEGGSFDTFHYSSTFGGGISLLRWQADRPFGFMENSLAFGHKVSLYNALEVDQPRVPVPAGTNTNTTTSPTPITNTLGVSRSYVTLRVQAHPRVAFDLSHNYFRDFPTFSPQLISTGLVDKLLFQGFSGGVRVDLPRRLGVYANLGRSSMTGDARGSLNQLYGLTFGDVPWIHVRADVRYSKFDSSFGQGQYRALSLSRVFGEGLRIELLGGEQTFSSTMTQQSNSHFLTTNVEWFLGRRYFLGSGFTFQRGAQMNYDQWFVNLGYRF